LTLIRNAPHLAHPLALLTPCMNWMEGIYYTAGLKMYDTLSGDLSIGKSEWLNKEEALKRNPSLTHKIHSAVLYYDGQLNDARYNMSLVKTAMQYGAVALNHAEARTFEKDAAGRLAVLHVRDSLTGRLLRVRAKRFINATGPFADRIRLLANPEMGKRMRVSKGVHIIVPGELMPSDAAILVPKTDDGRVVFIIPYNGKLMIGTTETESELGESEPVVERAEVDYLLSYVNRYFEKPILADQVIAGFAGLRPLLQADPNADTKQLVRDHEVEVDQTSGLISILGGKWTTYRLMAKDTIDKFYELQELTEKECITDHIKLVGAEGYADDFWKVLVSKYAIPEVVAKHLNRQYGTESLEIAQLMHDRPDWKARLSDRLPNTKAEVVFVVRAEMAQTLKDVLARRFGLELTDWQSSDQISETVADLMAAELGWTDAERQKAVRDYHAEIDWFRKSAGLVI
jgi:glycerol-3-phosphate dehydrogenase